MSFEVGDIAQSIESGWKGRIERFEGEGVDRMAVMKGINFLAEVMLNEEHIDEDDTQWFSPDDLRLVRKGAR